MTESGYTTITVREQTKEQLNEHRDGRPWDEYLNMLRREHADPLTFNQVDDLADYLSSELTDSMNSPTDTEAIAEEFRRAFPYDDLAERTAEKSAKKVEERLR